MTPPQKPRRKPGGFTLVEIVMVIVITGILAASLTVYLKPAADAYVNVGNRAALADAADTALRRIASDIRRAVPNSIRSVSATCFQLVPTIAGGRYRKQPDTINDKLPPPCSPAETCSAPLDITQATTVFDVLSPLSPLPQTGDWIIIDNQNRDDVYATVTKPPDVNSTSRPSRTQIIDMTEAATTGAPRSGDGLYRIRIQLSQFPFGYHGGRFVVVANTEQSVFYSCVGSTLYRTVTEFVTPQATACAATTLSEGAFAVADNVSGCTFVYDPAHGGPQNGFVWMRLELALAGERVTLGYGVHVDNVP